MSIIIRWFNPNIRYFKNY